MSTGTAACHGVPDWKAALSAYGSPLPWRSEGQLAGNLLAYAALWVGMGYFAERAYFVSLLLAIPAAGFALRIFSMQHDCGHGAFFLSRRANDWVGRLLSPITLTPYSFWRSGHEVHHATVGHLDRRGVGDIALRTVAEYRARPRSKRWRYRAYRHPLVLFGIGPIFQYCIRLRLPYNLPAPRRRLRNSVLLTDLTLLGIGLVIELTLGFANFLWLFVPMIAVATTAGVWIFYVHHEFETTYWARAPEWNHSTAAIAGSCHYALPGWLRWFSGNTGIHHVHHACSRIPNYRLPECLEEHPELAAVNRITLRESFACAWLSLWDEATRRLISFRRERETRPAGVGS